MITKEKFLRYETVRKSGQYNMIMEANYAMNEANLTKEEYFDIIKNYGDYSKKYL
jgi:hypothetical protein